MMLLTNVHTLEDFIYGQKIRFFRPHEFVCRHCGKVIIDADLVLLLERMRQDLQRPIIITSAYRCPEYNKQVGGVPNSAHTRGYAVDIAVDKARFRYMVISWLLDNGVTRIGIGDSFIHFDIDPEKPKHVIWHYYKKD